MTATLATPRPPLLPILLAAAIAGAMMGTSLPLVPLGLKLDDHPRWLAGAMSATWAAGVLCAGPVLPRLAARLGVVPVFMAGLALTALAMVLFPHVPKLPWWFALQFVLGIATSVPWILSETWINLAADDFNRGRVTSWYAFAITAGVAIGPLVATAAGPTTPLPFYICAALAVGVGIPVLAAAARAPRFDDQGEHGRVWPIARAAPAILAVALLAGLTESSVMNFLPIYALDHGVDLAMAPAWLSVFVAGNTILMLPIGWLADRIGVRATLTLCVIGTLMLTGALPFATREWLWVPVVFLWGGVLFGPYALGLAMIGQRFGGQQLAAANSAFVMTYTASGLVGPPVTGGLMDSIGPAGLPLTIAAVFGAALWLLLRRPGLVMDTRG